MEMFVSGELTEIEVGYTLVIAGTGYVLIVSVAAVEVPPPGAPVTTVICAEPGFAMSVALTATLSCVELTYVVVRFVPLNCTTDEGPNPLPLTLSPKAALPATTAGGFKDVIAGTG